MSLGGSKNGSGIGQLSGSADNRSGRRSEDVNSNGALIEDSTIAGPEVDKEPGTSVIAVSKKSEGKDEVEKSKPERSKSNDWLEEDRLRLFIIWLRSP